MDNKTVVVFGVNGDVASHISLRLALEGYRIIGAEYDPAKVRRVEREVEDVGGSFLPLIIDPDQTTWDAAFQTFADQLREVALVVSAPENGEGGRTPYDAFLTEYRQNDHVRQAFPHLAHIVDVVFHGMDSTPGQTVSLPGGVRFTRIYAENVDRTLHLDDDELSQRLASGDIAHFSPVLVANEILCLVTDKAYRQVSDIAFLTAEYNVYAALYGFKADGTPDRAQPANRVWRGSVLKTYLQETRHGKGVFAAQDFRRGDLVLENTGVVLHHQTEHSMQIGWDAHVEPDPPIRFINHSCDPNAGVRTNEHGFPDIVALADIGRGEEIFFDYAMTEFEHYNREDARMEFSLVCRCGSANCRGKLGYYSELSDELKERYRGFLSEYLVQWEKQRAYHSESAR